jgi:predicted metalloprotease with PDZ domain
MKRHLLSLELLLLFVVFPVFVLGQNISLSVDATDAAKNIFRVRETMPATAGDFTLFYPKWIPGEHAPTGMLNDLVDLYITADGKAVEWRRDDVEMFAFHCTVPAGAKQLEISFDYVSQPSTIASARLARIKWNRLVLYPRGAKSDDVRVTAALKLPESWDFATALEVDAARAKGPVINFKPVSLTKFVDSPALIGRYFKKIQLGNVSGAAHEMDIAADSPRALEYKAETLEGWRNLVKEANSLFGARHYDSYRFLLTLSDVGGDEGLEHHESSEDGVSENSLTDSYQFIGLSDLLGHEYAHSWNGKYRRPSGLATVDFEQPMNGELLWVYEGLTQYLGNVLPARSGLWNEEVFRESMSSTAAEMANQTGRRWRALVDTARAVQFTYDSPRAWRNQRRRVDYYDEGALIWMEADVLIRQKSGGRRSLDNFMRAFHGAPVSGPMVKPYDFEEIVRTLNEIEPFDWRKFFYDRVYAVNRNAPLGGITGGGWNLTYNETPNIHIQGAENFYSFINASYSIGVSVDEAGTISDVNPDLSAARAGLAPGMKITEVNGEEFSLAALHKAIAATKNNSPLELVAANGGVSETYKLEYNGGEKYPHLVRDAAKTDYLSEIIKPGATAGFVIKNRLGRRQRQSEIINIPPEITKLHLSRTEIAGSDTNRKIDVSAEGFDKEGDVLTYNYTVSAGKIVGAGAKVVWDLTGVEPGTYTINVMADDGCGDCGKFKAVQVKIVE